MRDEHRIIAERSENDLIYSENLGFQFLAEISDTENAIKRFRVAWIERAEHGFAVGQISKATGKLAAIGCVVVQEFRRAFILANAKVPVIGSKGNNAIVADLVNVLG